MNVASSTPLITVSATGVSGVPLIVEGDIARGCAGPRRHRRSRDCRGEGHRLAVSLIGLAEEVTVVFVAAWLTVWVRAVEPWLAVKLLSPAYEAVIVCDPTARGCDVVNVACPCQTRSVPVPSVVEPSLNVTVPVGVPLPGAAA